MLGLRNLVLLATSFALVSAVPAKTDSTTCKEVIGEQYSYGDWSYFTTLTSTSDPNSLVKVATGSHTFDSGTSCQFTVMYGYNSYARYDQMGQQVKCTGPILPEFKVSYNKAGVAKAPWKEYAIPTPGGQCGNYGGNFHINATMIEKVSVYYNTNSGTGGSG